MAKVFNNVQEVKEVRQGNEGILFNKAAALMALKSTPVKSRVSSGVSGMAADIVECFKVANQPLSTQQAMAMYAAAKGVELTKELKHSLSSTVWVLSDRNSKRKSPATLKFDEATGCYTLAA